MALATRIGFALVAVLILIVGAVPIDEIDAQGVNIPDDPAGTAVAISQLEAEGRFAEIYSLMHPDAQRIIPENVVIGWYQNEFWPLGPGVITVTGVQMVSWTWGVTGTTYPNTAEVYFQQPFANGTVVDEVVRLVEHEGQWRWFFGRSRAFVDEQIAEYGSVSTTSASSCEGADRWWADTFPRIVSAEYGAYTLPKVLAGGYLNEQLLRGYQDGFASLHDQQMMSIPPGSAEALHSDLLTIFARYENSTAVLADVATGQMNPLWESSSLAAGLQGLDSAALLLSQIDTKIDAFLSACEPIVVFISGMGEDLPIGVLPGETDSPRMLDCSAFASQAEAQRFFEAAQPGDPHRLDTDNDGLACK